MEKCTFSYVPTPLVPLAHMSKQLEVDLWIKRDDLTGCIATGGNKIRKLEYILADALKQGADTVITTGGPQSNHAKTTAALAVKVGLKPVLVLAGMDPGHRKANLFLDQLVGAEICFSGAYTPKQMEKALDNAYSEWKERGRNPYIVPIGGSNGLGTLGYVDAYQELGEHDFDWIVVTAGSGGTYAGLALGVLLDQHNKQTKLLGFSPWLEKQEIEKRVHQCMEQASELLPAEQKETIVALSFDRHERLLLDDQYIGSGYGRITPEASEAIRLFAQKEAILLDQVYTGKAMAGMLDYIQKGIIQPKEKVLFWHTGGAPGLFALDQI